MTEHDYSNRTDIDEVLMQKDDLLNIVLKNRHNHRDQYEAAMEGYKILTIEVLEERLEQIKNDEPKQVTLMLPLPEDHTDDYDEIIAMLKSNRADEITLDQQSYRTYVLDKWGWSASWTTSNTGYVMASMS